MNRKDLQSLTNARLREARILHDAHEYSGAYYLAGYSVECALKSCIAKGFKRHDFPDKKGVVDAHTHNLQRLVVIANLDMPRILLGQSDSIFLDNWTVVVRWSEESRYRAIGKFDCEELLNAIIERRHGLMPWIKRYW